MELLSRTIEGILSGILVLFINMAVSFRLFNDKKLVESHNIMSSKQLFSMHILEVGSGKLKCSFI